MKRSLLVVLSLLFFNSCTEEEVYPDGRELLPGVYDGFDENGIPSTAIVKFIKKNTYIIKVSGTDLNLEINIRDITGDKFIYFEVIDRSICKGNPNKFSIYNQGASPHITLSCCVKYSGRGNWWTWHESTESFNGSKPL